MTGNRGGPMTVARNRSDRSHARGERQLRCDLPFRGWLFPGQDRQRQPTGGHVTASQVSHLASRYLHDSGSASTFHALRHHFGTEVYRGSLDIRLTQDLLGHSSPAMTAGYTALAPGRAVDVVGQVAGSIGVAHRGPAVADAAEALPRPAVRPDP